MVGQLVHRFDNQIWCHYIIDAVRVARHKPLNYDLLCCDTSTGSASAGEPHGFGSQDGSQSSVPPMARNLTHLSLTSQSTPRAFSSKTHLSKRDSRATSLLAP
jgi:hypothetical protein